MAGGKLSGILYRLVIAIALFHLCMAQDQPIATALSVIPLWDAAIGNQSQPCHFEEMNNSQGIGFLHGSAIDICAIQINASLGFYTGIEIPSRDDSSESFFLHIERKGGLGICQNNHVIFPENTNACNVILLHYNLSLYLQGDVSLLITGIPVSGLESNPKCPEYNDDLLSDDTRINQTQNCQQIKGYIDRFWCFFAWGSEDVCQIVFRSNCNSTLNNREVTFQCSDDDLHHIEASIILHTEDISTG